MTQFSLTDDQAEGQYETRKQSDASSVDLAKRILAQIDLGNSLLKQWRREAEDARETFRAEEKGAEQRFNILFSNVQTSVPALYNSTPTPDVRTRYNEDDEVSRLSGQSIERVLSYSIDSYPFDATIKMCVQDRELAGLGQARVRYVPYENEGRVYQEVSCEHTPWKHFTWGPAQRWEDVPWIAFEHFLTRDQLMNLAPEIGGSINLDFHVSELGKTKADAAPNIYKRARVWEYWSKEDRKVYWIAPAYKQAPVRVDDDPLGLIAFFPCPAPLFAIRTSDSLVPVCPYRIVKPLVEELEEITVRIQALVRTLKWRGIRNPAIPSFERLEEAQDGELIAPLDGGGDLLALAQGTGGLAAHIWLMPIKEVMEVLQGLYTQREQIKGTIFEVTGMADIMRGQSNPNETLGAQEMKANFGTMRMQDGQKDVQRFCRDILRLKAEIACNLFDSTNLAMMTGLKLPSRQDVQMARMQLQQFAQQQPPPQTAMGHNGGPPMPPPQPPPQMVEMANQVAWEDVLETLKSGVMRSYKIDIETDSTVMGDSRMAQQQAGAFIQGMAQFIQALGPAVQSGFMKPDVAVDLFASMARHFKLGKQAEDALSRMAHEAQKQAKAPAPAPQPSPDQIKMQMETQRAQADIQMARERHGLEMQKMQAGIKGDMAGKQLDAASKQQDLQIKAAQAQLGLQTQYQQFAQQEEQARHDMVDTLRQAAIDEHMANVKASHEHRKMTMAEQKHLREMARPSPSTARN